MGKISIAYYLNQKVKPIMMENEDGILEPTFPLYLYLTVRRKTIHKPSAINVYLPLLFNLNSSFSEKKWKNKTIKEVFDHFRDIHDCIEYEGEMLKGIAEIHEKDYQNNQVKTAYRQLSSRGFNAKEEYVNDLNAYIEFYTEKVVDLTKRYERENTRGIFEQREKNISILLGELGDLVEIVPKSILGAKMINIYEKVFNQEELTPIYANYIIKLFEKKTTNKEAKQLGLYVYAWLYGEGKEQVWQVLEQEQKRQGEEKTLPERLLNMSREEYYTEIVPKIDILCSAEDRIDRAYSQMKRGI